MTCEDRQPEKNSNKNPWSLGTQTQAHDIKSMQLYTWRIQSVKHSINPNCTVLSGDGKSFTSCQAWGVCGYNTQVIIFRKKCRALVGQHHRMEPRHSMSLTDATYCSSDFEIMFSITGNKLKLHSRKLQAWLLLQKKKKGILLRLSPSSVSPKH